MKLKKGEFYVIEDYVVKYIGEDKAAGGVFTRNYTVYLFSSVLGELRLDRRATRGIKPATKLHKLLHGVE